VSGLAPFNALGDYATRKIEASSLLFEPEEKGRG
jgi:hypothetical protein